MSYPSEPMPEQEAGSRFLDETVGADPPDTTELSAVMEQMRQQIERVQAVAQTVIARIDNAGLLRHVEPAPEARPSEWERLGVAPFCEMVGLQGRQLENVEIGLHDAIRRFAG